MGVVLVVCGRTDGVDVVDVDTAVNDAASVGTTAAIFRELPVGRPRPSNVFVVAGSVPIVVAYLFCFLAFLRALFS